MRHFKHTRTRGYDMKQTITLNDYFSKKTTMEQAHIDADDHARRCDDENCDECDYDSSDVDYGDATPSA
jgi:hypothetical protein